MKNMFKKIAVAAAVVSSISFVWAEDISVNFTPAEHGVWVEVSQFDAPLTDVIINDTVVTDATGRAFVFAGNSKQLKINILTPDGDNIAKNIFIPQND